MAASQKVGELSPQTVIRIETLQNPENEDGPPAKKSVSHFKLEGILRESAREKSIFVQGKLDEQEAIIILEKTPITQAVVPELLLSTQVLEMKNDIYSTYHLQPPPNLNEIKTTMICPATDKHFKKYLRQEVFLVEETEEDYQSITRPYIITKGLSVEWVNNILEKKSEADRIIFDDPDPQFGFVLIPDFKWDQKQMDNLHLIAIVYPPDLKSLRDLTSYHLPLLMNIRKKGLNAIAKRYNIPASKLRMLLHYQPSYYHLHVHFIFLDYDAPGCGAERAHLLSDVIQNLQLNSNYYRERTFTFPLLANDALLSKFKEAGRI
ncbi:m7GpppX diphosphatase [Silurus asotus]|uniref:m7GpppX diphosphatase n=1 Tax=Silurus asotus TaxID=30991 RepID=A0AAD5FQG0_SILAS|nr:m7GpppX diphosphatase [Silurus asotus]